MNTSYNIRCIITAVLLLLIAVMVPTAHSSAADVEGAISRIEISLSGDYGMFSPIVTFTAIGKDGCSKPMLTSSDGNPETPWRKVYAEDPFESTFAIIVGEYAEFSCNISLENSAHNNGNVKVLASYYQGSKLIKQLTLGVTFAQSDTEQFPAYHFDSVNGFTKIE